MSRMPTVSASEAGQSALPPVVLNPTVALQSTMLEIWRREASRLFVHIYTRLMGAENAQEQWADAIKSRQESYENIAVRLAERGEKLNGITRRHAECLDAGFDEKSAFYLAHVKPICAEMAEILKDARGVLPAVHREYVRLLLKARGYAEVENAQYVIDSEARKAGSNCLYELHQLERRFRVLGTLPDDPADSVDLVFIGKVLAMMMAGTQYTGNSEGQLGVVVQGQSHRCEAVVMVLARGMIVIAAEARVRQQRKSASMDVFDIEKSLAAGDGVDECNLGIVGREYLLNFSTSESGALHIGIPVCAADYELLGWLRDQVGVLCEQYGANVKELSATLSTELKKMKSESDDGLSEYTLTLAFSGSVETPLEVQKLPSYDVQSTGDSTDAESARRGGCLQQRTLLGRQYYAKVDDDGFVDGELVDRASIRGVVESLVEALGVNFVRFRRIQSSRHDAESTGLGEQDGFDSSSDGFDKGPELWDGAEEEQRDGAPKPSYVIVFSAGQSALGQGKIEESKGVDSRSVERLRKIGSHGFDKAGRKLLQSQPSPPSTHFVALDTVLLNEQARNLLEQLRSKCAIGDLQLTFPTKRALSYLNAAVRAVDDFLGGEPAQTVSIDLRVVLYSEDPHAPPIQSVCLQLRSPSGHVVAEGVYSPSKEAFEMVLVPQSVIEPLSRACVDAFGALLEAKGVIRIVDLAQEIEKRGFKLADTVLIHLHSQLKTVEKDPLDAEALHGALTGFLAYLLSRTKTRPLVYDENEVCSILEDSDVPPGERG